VLRNKRRLWEAATRLNFMSRDIETGEAQDSNIPIGREIVCRMTYGAQINLCKKPNNVLSWMPSYVEIGLTVRVGEATLPLQMYFLY